MIALAYRRGQTAALEMEPLGYPRAAPLLLSARHRARLRWREAALGDYRPVGFHATGASSVIKGPITSPLSKLPACACLRRCPRIRRRVHRPNAREPCTFEGREGLGRNAA